MEFIIYTEEDLFRFAFKHGTDKELLEILIKDFGLDVNWRKKRFYDTLLYQALKLNNLDVVEFLISKGACVNCSLGGYPSSEDSHGNLSLLDVVEDVPSLRGKCIDRLKQLGAISFENLPEDKIKAADLTRQASDEKYIYRTVDQVKLIIMLAPSKVQEKLKSFISSCKYETLEDIQNKNNSHR